MKFRYTLLLLCLLQLSYAQELYFPPATSAWETTAPEDLGWCEEELNDLQDFLAERDTKAFIVLKNGRMVLEWYYDDFTQDSIWYWASAGKAMTATLIGIAQEEGLLSIDDPTSDYLGEGWTQLTPEQEEQITIRHQLTMTTGLNDIGINVDCTDPECLTYLQEPGTRWAYHNAPYTLLGAVIESASGLTFNQYLNSRVLGPIGGFGAYIALNFNRVMFSRPRDMARFGLMTLANGQWDGTSILGDQEYLTQMSTPSQDLNPSYGFLWWLNGQESFQQPRLQFNFPGSIIPTAPDDMFAGLGKNDQKVYVVPSEDMVVVRLGDDAGEGLLALTDFDGLLWEKIMSLECGVTNTLEAPETPSLTLAPNPVQDQLQLTTDQAIEWLHLISLDGRRTVLPNLRQLDLTAYPAGIYWLEVKLEDSAPVVRKIVVQ
ncbi:MAG: serine hydrolase [Bacteroidota bacterium]